MHYDKVPMGRDPKCTGPLKNRSCTDLPCLLIFLVFIGGWITVGYYAFHHGDFHRIFPPTDSHGKRCGIDTDVSNKPYLVFFDLRQCLKLRSAMDFRCKTPQVCVDKCPSSDWNFQSSSSEDLEQIKRKLICIPGINIASKSKSELSQLVKKKACAEQNVNSEPIAGRCFPMKIEFGILNFTLTNDEMKHGRDMVEDFRNKEQILIKMMNTKGTILMLIFGSAIVCLIFIILLKWLALPCIFISIVGVCSLLFYCAHYCYIVSKEENSTKLLVFAIALGSIGGIIAFLSLCLWKRIYLACQLIKEASKAVMSTLTSLIFPFIPWLIHLCIIAYILVAGLSLYSIGERKFTIDIIDKDDNKCFCPPELNYTRGASCQPDKFNELCREKDNICLSQRCNLNGMNNPPFLKYYYAVHFIGGIWLYCFVSALGEMILAAIFATYYWTFKKSDMPYFTLLASTWRTFRYHLGTVAFGSFLITVVRCFRFILTFIRSQAEQPGNSVGNTTKMCSKCASCCLGIFERFLKFINTNAYIICAIYGKGLCQSAADALSLLTRNVLRAVVLNNIVSWLLLAGKLLVTGMMAALTWWYYHLPENHDDYWWVPVILVSIGSFLVARAFFNVYEMAVDTIFLCFLEDCDINDGTREKPYYMSKGLSKLFNLRNGKSLGPMCLSTALFAWKTWSACELLVTELI